VIKEEQDFLVPWHLLSRTYCCFYKSIIYLQVRINGKVLHRPTEETSSFSSKMILNNVSSYFTTFGVISQPSAAWNLMEHESIHTAKFVSESFLPHKVKTGS
jgi:hypothetical protein